MPKIIKRLSILAPVAATVAALILFFGCLVNPRRPDWQLAAAELVLIGSAIAQWVSYFRGYVDLQIEKRMEERGKSN
jgi:hypothetical protein